MHRGFAFALWTEAIIMHGRWPKNPRRAESRTAYGRKPASPPRRGDPESSESRRSALPLATAKVLLAGVSSFS
eukprot:5823456-Prymnesium_polylepis.1